MKKGGKGSSGSGSSGDAVVPTAKRIEESDVTAIAQALLSDIGWEVVGTGRSHRISVIVDISNGASLYFVSMYDTSSEA